jgi:hypothetical protein
MVKILIFFFLSFSFVKGVSQTPIIRDHGSIQDTSRTITYVIIFDNVKYISNVYPSNDFEVKWVKSIEVLKDGQKNTSLVTKSDSVLIYIKKKYYNRVHKYLKTNQ